MRLVKTPPRIAFAIPTIVGFRMLLTVRATMCMIRISARKMATKTAATVISSLWIVMSRRSATAWQKREAAR